MCVSDGQILLYLPFRSSTSHGTEAVTVVSSCRVTITWPSCELLPPNDWQRKSVLPPVGESGVNPFPWLGWPTGDLAS